MGSYIPLSKIAIIGAGPSGIAAAKYLLAEKSFHRIDIIEQRDRIGGVWNYSSAEWSSRIPIPQTDPNYAIDTINPSKREEKMLKSTNFESPIYDTLETNIPHNLMQYSDKPFPPDIPLFPRHEIVLDYLEEYAKDVKHLIQFNTRTTDIELLTETPVDQWNIATEHVQTKEVNTSIYDAVVVAAGHYTVPHVPRIIGIEEWNQAYPGVIIHSKAYRNPESFKDEKVVVIGNSASGVDIAAQIGRTCRHPLLLSSRSESQFISTAASWKRDKPEIVEFLPPSMHARAVRFSDGNLETNIDAIIFATGYFYSYPFFSKLNPPIVTDGLRTRDVYQHLFHIDRPTLAFPVLNLKVIPFPLAENQAAVIARVWSGRLCLTSKEKMRDWERKTIERQGNGKNFHVLKFPMDADYLNEMYRWAASAPKVDGLENDGLGKMGTFWDEKQVWMRERFPAIKKAYAERGDQRKEVRAVEELGFDFEEWKREQANKT